MEAKPAAAPPPPLMAVPEGKALVARELQAAAGRGERCRPVIGVGAAKDPLSRAVGGDPRVAAADGGVCASR